MQMGERNETRVSFRLLAAALLVVVLAGPLGCSSTSRQATQVSDAPASDAGNAVQVRTPASIERLDVTDDGRQAALELSADRPLVWTSFRNPDGDLVVELPNARPSAAVVNRLPASGLVASVEVDSIDDAERPLTRLVVRTSEPSEHSLMGEGDHLVLQLVPIGSAQDVALAYEPLSAESLSEESLAAEGSLAEETLSEESLVPAPVDEAPIAVAETMTEPTYEVEPMIGRPAHGTPEQPDVGPAPSGRRATELYSVNVLDVDGGTIVQVAGDGAFAYSTFRLQNPERFVVDLGGVVNSGASSTVSVGSAQVDQVRVGQFKPRPDPVSRVVFDLREFSVPTIERSGERLLVRFGDVSSSVGMAVADVSEPDSSMIEPEPEPEPVEVVTTTTVTTTTYEPIDSNDAEPVPTYQPPPSYEAPAEVADVPAYEPTTAPAPMAQPTPAEIDVATFEAQQVDVIDGRTKQERLLQSFDSLVVSRQEKEYVGEPISMSLKRADLVETLRSFAKISDLNFVIQPGVSGSVTVELKSVPWDQAMEQILKINGLGMDIDGTIVRIAPRQQLQAEADAQRRLQRSRQQSIPLRTVMRSLSYANAGEMQRMLRSREGAIISRRGAVQIDDRTNTLIIRELPSNIDTVLAVIDNLDTPEPQVTIEARIVEATKVFNKSLGIQWSFDYDANPALGNTTGLQFPNTVDGTGGIGLLTGGANGFLNLSMGNILDSFRLDAVLQVAESEGLVNVVSAPRITTLNNTSATIQSGIQIPVQTVSDGTVSVQFVNATLNLNVTPQVTAEGTVQMQISVSKRSPQPGLAVAGAPSVPIATKEAKTTVIVRDGGTIVIGGIYTVQSDKVQDRVPGLSNIPILGHLFKNRNRNESNDELMIFITPRIVQL